MRISSAINDFDALTDILKDLGCHGWKLIAITGADMTLGTNQLIAVMRRPMVSPPAPDDPNEGWKVDPCGRWDVRWWDGIAWTYDVGTRGDKNLVGRDAPTMLPPYTKPSWKT